MSSNEKNFKINSINGKQTLKITNAGFLENLKNATFSNDLMAITIEGETANSRYLAVASSLQEDGSAQGYCIEGCLMKITGTVIEKTQVKGYLSYYDRSKPGRGTLTIEIQ